MTTKKLVSLDKGKKYCVYAKRNGLVKMGSCKGTHRFRYVKKSKTVRNMKNTCLEIQDSHDDANIIREKPCIRGKKSQKWRRYGKHFVSKQNGKCMDIEGGNYKKGYLIGFPCHKGPNQKFV